MDLQEKKYLVDSFATIQKLLKAKKAPKVRHVTSTHYYGQHKGNDVEKFVEYLDRFEIHVWKDTDGKMTMIEHSPIPDKEAGFNWLKKRGFNKSNIVKMDYTEYAYKDGTVGLYTIDDFLQSVILSYPAGKHEVIEKELRLEKAKVITVPYNNLLEQMGRLRSMNLKEIKKNGNQQNYQI